MQVSLFEVTIGAQFILLAGYLLYGIVVRYSAANDRFSVSFYITILIGFITSILVLNAMLSLSRFLLQEVLLVKILLTLDIIFFLAVLGNTFRLYEFQTDHRESQNS